MWDSPQVPEAGSALKSQLTGPILRTGEKIAHNRTHRCGKSIKKNPTAIHDENFQGTRDLGKFLRTGWRTSTQSHSHIGPDGEKRDASPRRSGARRGRHGWAGQDEETKGAQVGRKSGSCVSVLVTCRLCEKSGRMPETPPGATVPQQG